MGDVLVENTANQIPPHKKTAPSTIPSIESFEGITLEGGDDYAALKKLQRQLEYIQLQEEYIKDEQRCVSPWIATLAPRACVLPADMFS